MWDIEEDWSEDESFGLVSKPGTKRKKLDGLTESGKLHCLEKSVSGGESMELDENSSINSRDISLSKVLESLDKRLSDSRAKGSINRSSNIDMSVDFGADQSSDCGMGLQEEVESWNSQKESSELCSSRFESICCDLSFEQAYDTFGLNTIKTLRGVTQTFRSNKIFEGISIIERPNKGIIRFSGVSDPSKTFFVETWEREDTLGILKELKSREERPIGGKKKSKLDVDIVEGNLMEEFGFEFKASYDPNIDSGSNEISRTYTNRPVLTTKYVPKSCLDLVNDEGSIRNILRWIKSWDNFVFKSVSSKKSSEAPEVPILLIGGPSGSGKTSMVKILARQCGYEVNEIKVSDEKTMESFENSIKMGINFGTIKGSSKPSLIMIDELDSLSNSGNVKKSDCFNFLVKLAETHSKTRETVSRPIICICNDVHERSLRFLRAKSLNIVIPSPPKEKIFKRLSYVCRSEGLRLEDDEILNELIKIHNCDIRSCLNSIYLMGQKEVVTEDGDNDKSGRKRAQIPIYWEDFESCCYTKDVDQDISGFIKTCFGLETGIKKDEIFEYVLEYGEECLMNFGLNLAGLLTENIYRCNLINDFYYDYLKVILDSIVEHNVLSTRTSSLLPFLSSATLVSKKIMGLHCNQFRHLGSSTFTFSQSISNSISNIYRDISSSTLEIMRVDTMTNSFKVYTLPSMLTHFNGIGFLKHLNQWKSTKIFPKFKCIIGYQTESLSSEELESLSVLKNLVSKMVCFGLKFEDQTSGLFSGKNTTSGLASHFLKPNIESLYSFQCLMNSIDSGYVRNPSVLVPSPEKFIYDVGFYTLINQLVEFFKEDISKQIIPGIHYFKPKSFCKKNTQSNEKNTLLTKQVPDDTLVSIPTFQDLINKLKVKARIESEKPNSFCIYRYNDGCTDAVKMEVQLSDFFLVLPVKKQSGIDEILSRMKISAGFGCLLLVLAHILCVNAIHSGIPNYRTVYVSRRKVPHRPLPERFRGELYSDGSIGWLCSRRVNGRWTRWTPVSEARVPPQMLRQLKSQLARRHRNVPQVYRERVVSPLFEEFDQEILLERDFEPVHPSTPRQHEKQFTWEEENSSHEDSPLQLQQMSPAPATSLREYNSAAGRQPVLRQSRIERRTVPGGVQQSYQQTATISVSPEEEADIARYFEEQNTSPITGRRGIKETLKDAFKITLPELELATPTITQKTSIHTPQGFIPIQPHQPSDYDLNRMQWKFFLTSYNPGLDNIRIIKRIPPLGMKLSKTVTECTNNYYKAFKLHYLTVSGIMYSKKISRSVSNSINRELRQWCSGMMTNWYRQLQKMGLVVPKPNRFTR
ncbi:RF-C Ctf18p AAA+ ATpase [Cryptosporidium sp. chipmunk genotype I]|uniref:RF-C Ctf18p AAA+ ATpase n=1 Tax=Cryptosporidium sp. chipmunk genotype I TaxID=1280935 RepID=UPI00351A447E|nr:RF-C Ctf18p AAA+ ATpase [Cryptosporidium sp. chipmunk genotype I]